MKSLQGNKIMNSTVEYFEECYHFKEGYTYSSIREFPESKRIYQILEALVALLDGFLIIPTILLNVIAAKTIIKSPKLKEKPCFFLVLVQSLFDTGVGTISLPLYTLGLATQAAGIAKCGTNDSENSGVVFKRFIYNTDGNNLRKIHGNISSSCSSHYSNERTTVKVHY